MMIEEVEECLQPGEATLPRGHLSRLSQSQTPSVECVTKGRQSRWSMMACHIPTPPMDGILDVVSVTGP